MLHDLMVEAYTVTSQEKMREYLTYYAGLRYEILQIGYPTTGFARRVWLRGSA